MLSLVNGKQKRSSWLHNPSFHCVGKMEEWVHVSVGQRHRFSLLDHYHLFDPQIKAVEVVLWLATLWEQNNLLPHRSLRKGQCKHTWLFAMSVFYTNNYRVGSLTFESNILYQPWQVLQYFYLLFTGWLQIYY